MKITLCREWFEIRNDGGNLFCNVLDDLGIPREKWAEIEEIELDVKGVGFVVDDAGYESFKLKSGKLVYINIEVDEDGDSEDEN